MPFEIVRNDITNMQVDAIVNTANPRPVIGSGTDSAIHRKAGPALLRSRREIGDIAPGHSAATPAFGLSAKYVLHTVGPAWIDGNHHETELLRQAYDAVLQLAEEKKCESVAFPLMAAGSYGFPKDKALSVAIQAFTDFLMASDMMIYLVVFNSEAYSLSGGLFADVKSYIDENYVAEQSEWEYSRGYGRERNYRRRMQEMDICGDMVYESAPMPTGPSPKIVEFTEKLSDIFNDADETFTEALLRMLKEHGEKDSVVYRQACISRQLFNKIINDKYYQPKKGTVIQLAIGLELDLSKTQELLSKAGYVLTRSSKTDLVVQYFINHKRYSMVAIDTALADANLPTICRY